MRVAETLQNSQFRVISPTPRLNSTQKRPCGAAGKHRRKDQEKTEDNGWQPERSSKKVNP